MAFISELHYSNAYAASSGTREFVEITLAPGENPADFQVGFYNFTGNVGLVVTLNDPALTPTTLPDGSTVYVIGRPDFNILLTDPDGGATGINYEAVALVDTANSTVEQFWDIGGGTQQITANDGPAMNAQSTTINPPTGPNASTYTIQFSADDPTSPIFEPVTEGAPVCYCDDVQILTATGLQPIGAVDIGTTVQTVGQSLQKIRWIGRQYISPRRLSKQPNIRPVVISAGALGSGLPQRDLRVSRQHRIAISGPIAKRMFHADQVLIAAKDLLPLPGIFRDDSLSPFSYVHIALDQHSLIKVEGITAETLLPGPMALTALSDVAREELLSIFGADALGDMVDNPALPLVSGPKARKMIKRHQRNNLGLIG
ncbi:Hint domain-containing protein [Roseovarius sp. EL26]|uniref:Hint domain-containing protein n=1 Tax=Roseovarius sp. EL26 TaxID=2126672 RepID=UPI000EA1E644|nr:Hint domain-containing protein [Roseovarius sp. EL26]